MTKFFYTIDRQSGVGMPLVDLKVSAQISVEVTRVELADTVKERIRSANAGISFTSAMRSET